MQLALICPGQCSKDLWTSPADIFSVTTLLGRPVLQPRQISNQPIMRQQFNALMLADMIKRSELLFRSNIRMGKRSDFDHQMIVGVREDGLSISCILLHLQKASNIELICTFSVGKTCSFEPKEIITVFPVCTLWKFDPWRTKMYRDR